MAPKTNRSLAIISFSLILVFIMSLVQNPAAVGAQGLNSSQGSPSMAQATPVLNSPSGTTSSTTPIFQWNVIRDATNYQYQLVQGTTTILSTTLASSDCVSSSCSATSTTSLTPGTYKWRARAYVRNWKTYSAYMSFSVTVPLTDALNQAAPAATVPPTVAPTQIDPLNTQVPTDASTVTVADATQVPTVAPTQAAPTATVPPTAAPTQAPIIAQNTTGIHAIGLTWPDYSTSRAIVPQVEQQLKAAGMNMIALNAGRVEWTEFKWAGNQSSWAGAVTDTGIDYLAQDAARFRQWAHVDAMIDVFSPNYILAHPDKAAINALGVHSTDLVSTVEMVNGAYSQRLLAMIEYIAANYPVNSISLTELQYRVDGYGPDDTASYLAYSKRTDWPRNSDGSINIDDSSIGTWRSYMIGTLLSKATAIAHKYGKQLYMDVTLNVNNLALMANNKGQNYKVMLQNADKIIVWGYFAEDQYPPTTFVKVGQFLSQLGQDRVILSIGLWGATSTTTASASDVQVAIQSAQTGGMPNVWITPYSLTTTANWQSIDALWGLQLAIAQ